MGSYLDGVRMRVPGMPSGPEAGDGAPEPNPDMGYPVYQPEQPLPNQLGDTGPTSFDYATEMIPVYQWKGEEFIGDLRYAPSWPQDLQPVRYVQSPLTPGRMT